MAPMYANDWGQCSHCGCSRPLGVLRPGPDGSPGYCPERDWCERARRIREEVEEEFERLAKSPQERIEAKMYQRWAQKVAKDVEHNRENAGAHRESARKSYHKRKRSRARARAKRICGGCPTDISDKAPQAKWCSPTCQKRIAARKAKEMGQ